MRVLVVEDDLSLADALRRGLAEHGYAVDLAHDGEEGLLLASSEPYDLLILDVMLPGLDGSALCRRLRARGRATPVLMIPAAALVGTLVLHGCLGADQ